MSDEDQDLAEAGPDSPAGCRVVVRRNGRWPKGLMCPLAILAVAVFALAYRVTAPDWRGLVQEAKSRLGGLTSPREEPGVAVDDRADDAIGPVATTPKTKPADAKSPAAWDDIRREAEAKKAELAEARKLKAEAEETLALSPPPPPSRPRGVRRGFVPNPDLARFARARQQPLDMMRQMQLQHAEMERRFRGMMDENHRLFDQLAAGRRDQGRLRDPFHRPLPGLPDPFGPALPDLFVAPGARLPLVEDRSGEAFRDGVRIRWRTRAVVIGPGGQVGQ